MFALKKIAGFYAIDNGDESRLWLRVILLLVSFFGTISTAILTGTPIDPNKLTSDISMIVQTIVNAYLAHAFYNLAFRR